MVTSAERVIYLLTLWMQKGELKPSDPYRLEELFWGGVSLLSPSLHPSFPVCLGSLSLSTPLISWNKCRHQRLGLMAIPACTLLHYLNLEWTARFLLLSSSLQLSEVSDLWFLLCHLTKLQRGAAQRSPTIWQIWAPPLYLKETGFWLHGHVNRHAKPDAHTERKWKREWALHLRAVGEEFEQCLPRGVIFYSLCPSVAWPGALGLTVSALNTADTDSSELRHTWDEGRGVKEDEQGKKREGKGVGMTSRALRARHGLYLFIRMRETFVFMRLLVGPPSLRVDPPI